MSFDPNNPLKCVLCDYETTRCNALVRHYNSYHSDVSLEDVYIACFMKSDGEMFCNLKECNNITTFNGLLKGFSKFCSSRCGAVNQHKDPKYGRMSSERLLKKWEDDEYRTWKSQRSSEQWDKDGYRENFAEKITANWEDNEYRTRESERRRRTALETWKNPDIRNSRVSGIRENFKDPEYYRLHVERIKKFCATQSFRDGCSSRAKERWKNEEYAIKMLSSVFGEMNGLEKFFDDLTPDCVWYASGSFFKKSSSGRYISPDFKISNKNIVIELNGNYWHTEEDVEEKTELWEIQGLKCLNFWEDEVYNHPEEVLSQVMEFVDT